MATALYSVPQAPSRWITDIEPYLAWGAIAYGAGFLTVMWHTSRLGIPVIQLIEPINIWVGAPVAIVLFLLRRIALYARDGARQFRLALQNVRAEEHDLTTGALTLDEAYDRLVKVVDAARTLFPTLFPWPLDSILTSILRVIFSRETFKAIFSVTATPTDTERQKQQKAIAYLERTLSLISTIEHLSVFVLRIAPLFLIPLALFVYTSFAYPAIPQRYGGGAPMKVELLLEIEKIPERTPNFTAIFRSDTNHREVKAQLSKPLTLHYETEHALYVSTDGSDRVMMVNSDAVSGVIFNP